MPTQSNASEIETLRFVTIRKAEGADTATILQNSLHSYDAWQHDNIDIWERLNDITDNVPDEYQVLSAQVTAIRSEGQVCLDVAEVEGRYYGFRKIYSWLLAQDIPSLTPAMLQAKVQEVTGQTVAAFNSSSEIPKVRAWDTLIVESIRQTSANLGAAIMEVLRVYNVMLQINNPNFNYAVAEALRIPFVLPFAIFPFKRSLAQQPSGSSTRADEARQKVNALQTKITNLRAAISDINKVNSSLLEGIKYEYESYPGIGPVDADWQGPQQAAPVALNGYWNVGLRDMLQQETLQAAGEVVPAVNNNYRASFVADALQRELNENIEALSRYARLTDKVVNVNGIIINVDNDIDRLMEVTPAVISPLDVYPAMPKVEPVGIADYKKVVQKLVCYQPGEIAHIENVMKTEHKNRSTRELNQQETITFTSTETETEDIKDLQTTDRFELQRETQKVVEQDTATKAGVNFSAQYGVMHLEGGVSFAMNTSRQEAEKSATDYARSVTERAVHRVLTRTRDEKSVRIFHEFEEKNDHGFDNSAGADHVVGIFRWVDKVYECKVVNYGKRMMFSFMVPEPAAFHIYANTQKAPEGLSITKPRHPKNEGINPGDGYIYLKSASDLNETNYLLWASAYGASDVAPYPQFQKVVSKSFFVNAANGNNESTGGMEDIALPDGYKAKRGWIRSFMGAATNDYSNMKVLLGRNEMYEMKNHNPDKPSLQPLNDEEGSVPLNYVGYQTASYGFNIEIECEVTEQWKLKWKVGTYDTIMAAFQQRQLEYEEALAKMKNEAGVYISGTNPARLREIERTELKKGSIQLLNDEYYFNRFDAAYNPLLSQENDFGDGTDYPWFKNGEAINDGTHAQFFETAFEWDIMSYVFHPYFWAKKKRWVSLYKTEDADATFTDFLQAGYAQVLVPVRPGFEDMIIYFCQTGRIWLGNAKPPLNATQYRDLMIDVQKEPENVDDDTVEKWTLRVPTNLVILQNSASGVTGDGLPCDPLGI